MLSGRDWIEVEQACTIERSEQHGRAVGGLLEGALAAYLRRLLDVIDQRITEREAAFLAALAARKKADRSLVGHAAHASLAAVGVRAAPDSADPEAHELRYQRTMALLAVLLGAAAGGLAAPADGSRRAASDAEAVRDVARHSGLHLRDVELSGGWHRRDVGPLIGWEPAKNPDAADQAVALVFRRGRYHSVDPFTGAASRLSRAAGQNLRKAATQVQVPLPPESGIGAALRLGAAGVSRDVRGLLIAGVVAACLGLAVPVVTGTVLGRIATGSSSDDELRVLPIALIAAARAGRGSPPPCRTCTCCG